MKKKKAATPKPKTAPAKPKPTPAPAEAKPPLSQKYENVAQLLFKGVKNKEIAQTLGIGPHYIRTLTANKRITERVREIAAEYALQQKAANAVEVGQVHKVTVTRNEIINGLATIARNGFGSERARVAAWIGLSDIFMLRARNLKEVEQGYGWTDDELLEFATTGNPPERIRQLLNARPCPLVPPGGSLRTDKKSSDQG